MSMDKSSLTLEQRERIAKFVRSKPWERSPDDLRPEE